MSSLKRLIYDVRVAFNDSEANDQTYVNNVTHQFMIENPETYSTQKIILVGNTPYVQENVNCFFAVADNPFKIIINEVDANIITQHFSFVNLLELNSFSLVNPTGTLDPIDVQLFYATVAT